MDRVHNRKNGRTLLASFAHPDDEAFGVGGTLAHYAGEGVKVVLVCATRGEEGEISDPALATAEKLGEVRDGELRCAAQALGVQEPTFLGYRDSGMEGTHSNHDARAFMNAPADEVVSRLVGIIRKERPEVVVTFEPNGGYGHPDHMAIHRHTVAAFHAAGDPNRYPEQGPAWQPDRLFYTAIPRSFFLEMRDRLADIGVDTSQFDRFEDAGAGWPDDQVNVALNVEDKIEQKWAALHCHATQMNKDSFLFKLPEEMVKEGLSREHFALAWPAPKPGQRLGDLFEGLG